MNQNKKIAIFHNLPSGGGFRMLEKITIYLKRENYVKIYIISDLPLKKIDGVDYEYLQINPWKGFFLRYLWILLCLPNIHRKVAKNINKNFETAFVTHDYITKSPFLLRYLKIPTTYLCQEPQREFYESNEIHSPNIKDRIVNLFRYPIKIIDEHNVLYAKKVICNSLYSKKIIDKIYNVKSKVVYPGVDEKYFKPSGKKKNNSLLCVGGLNPVKDQIFLIKKLKFLSKKYKLVLIGSGKEEYVKKIRDLNNGDIKIEIRQNIDDIELRKYYQDANVTLITAHNEPFGLSSIESQSCGTPVVAVNEGGLAENIVNGRTGYLVDRNGDDFLSKVNLAIKNGNKMGIQARKYVVSKWTWDKTLKQI